jgi:hypothetical protein
MKEISQLVARYGLNHCNIKYCRVLDFTGISEHMHGMKRLKSSENNPDEPMPTTTKRK